METPSPVPALTRTTISPRKTKLTYFTFGFLTALIMAGGMFAVAYSLVKNSLPPPELPSPDITQTALLHDTPTEPADLVPSPAETKPQTEIDSLRQLSISYSPNPNWETYTDSAAGFSLQYPAAPTGLYNFHQAISNAEPGKGLTLNTCNTPTTGPGAGQEVCLKTYDLTVYSNYAGSSRREWFTQNLTSYPDCQVYFADLTLAGQNALVATSNCSSWGETYILIPDGSRMLALTVQGYSRNATTGIISLSAALEETLSTFRLLN